jgi:hypothetical protein
MPRMPHTSIPHTSHASHAAHLMPRMPHKSAAGCTMGIAHPPGYPLFTMLAWLLHKLPVGSPAWRINLLSVLLATASAWLYSCPLYSCPLYVAVLV